MSKIKIYWKKFWQFIWHEDSVASWIANAVLAFILIKFIVYPVLGLILATSHPVVAVVSGSMEHHPHNFDEWWESEACSLLEPCTQKDWYLSKGITKEEFKEFSFKNGFNTGDIMILKGIDPKKVKVGDIIVFQTLKKEPIIHRVVNIFEDNGKIIYQTKGDNNRVSFSEYVKDSNNDGIYSYPEERALKGTPNAIPYIDEEYITEDQISQTGKAIIRIPYIGYIKLIFVRIITTFI